MLKNTATILRLLPILFLFWQKCSTYQNLEPIKIPRIDYHKLSQRYFHVRPSVHLPLTVEREENLHPVTSKNGYLFYTSSLDGTGDIWLRDLQTTSYTPLIEHLTEQYKPAVNANATLLAFVSEDKDERGDLRIVNLENINLRKRLQSGERIPNFWYASIDLSARIQGWAKENLTPKCRGSFAETDPDWNAVGDRLLFVSDRCTPGIYNVWLIDFKANAIHNVRQLTKLGGRNPRFSPKGDKIVFVSYRDKNRTARLYLLNLETLPLREVELPLPRRRAKQKREFSYASPDFTQDNQTIVYISTREDTNRDGLINLNDNSAIYSATLSQYKQALGEKEYLPEKQLLESATILHGLCHSNLVDSSVLYTAVSHRSINIYLIPSLSIIPREKDIASQYQLTRRYLQEAEGRYLLSLDSVRHYFHADPAYVLYEAKLLVDRLTYFRSKKQKAKVNHAKQTIKQTASLNPYIAFYHHIYEKKLSGIALSNYISNFQKIAAEKTIFAHMGSERAYLIQAAVLHEEARALLKNGKIKQTLQQIKQLNTNYQNYYKRDDTLLLQARLEFMLKQEFPMILNTMVNREKPKLLERIQQTLYELYINEPFAKDHLSKLQALQKNASLSQVHPLLKNTLRLVLAQRLLENGSYRKALKLAMDTQAKIPKRLVSFLFLPKKGWNGLHTRLWLIIEQCYQALGDTLGILAARTQLATNYDKQVNIKLKSKKFQELMASFDNQTRRYLQLAYSLSQKYLGNAVKTELVLGTSDSYLNLGAPLKPSPAKSLQLSGLEFELLYELCTQSVYIDLIFQRLPSKYFRQYENFCSHKDNLLSKERQKVFSKQSAQNAINLLYVVSYANAKIANYILFNVYRSGSLQDVSQKHSIYFQRLAVDITVQQKQHLLAFLPIELKTGFISANSNFYNTDIFSEMKKDYEFLYPQAIFNQNLSVLYGYAYLLIRKNVERENLQLSLQNLDYSFSLADLQGYKREVLRELKEAKNLLKYILNIDPLHVDASLLLGWLQQYIEKRREFMINYRYGFLLLRTEKDKQLYADLYDIYFPKDYYKENIELYQQMLARMQNAPSGIANSTALARLHLNLANNYFNLLNFKEAQSHYQEVISIFRNLGRYEFESYKQRGSFYFNFARTLFHQGYYEKAISYFIQCYELYSEKEYTPLKAANDSTHFALASSVKQRLTPELVKQHNYHFSSAKEQLKSVRVKMALLSALIGLSYWESGLAKRAVVYYKRADYHLYKEGAAVAKSLPNFNLLNYLAIAYQATRQLTDAEQNTRRAAKHALDLDLRRDDKRYEPSSYWGKDLALLFRLGEDFSVLGPGRNPYGFSPLRQYELALSIQLENMIIRGNVEQAIKLLNKKRNVFYKYDLDLKHGKKGYINTFNQEALLYYKEGKYQKAALTFKKAADEADYFGGLSSYLVNYSNYFKVLLSIFEYANPPIQPELALQQIATALSDLTDFESNYRERFYKDFIKKRTYEFADYEFDEERDGATLEMLSRKKLLQITLVKANLLFYKGYFLNRFLLEKNVTHKPSYMQDLENFEQAITLTKGVLEDISTIDAEESEKPYYKALTIRSRYNLSRFYVAKGHLHLARDLLKTTAREAYELRLIREEILLRSLLVEVLQELHKVYGTVDFVKQALIQVELLVDAFLSNPHQYDNMYREAEKIRQQALGFLLQQGKTWLALDILEKSWNLELQWRYFRHPKILTQAKHQEIYNKIRKYRKKLLYLDEKQYELLVNNKNTKDLEQNKQESHSQLRKKLITLGQHLPKHKAFLHTSFRTNFQNKKVLLKSLQPRLARSQLLMRFFANDNVVACWCFGSESKQSFLVDRQGLQNYKNLSIHNKPNSSFHELALVTVMRNCLASQKDHRLQDLFLISDKRLFASHFNELLASIDSKLPKAVFVTRLDDTFLGKASSEETYAKNQNLNLLNVGLLPDLVANRASASIQKLMVLEDQKTGALKLLPKDGEKSTHPFHYLSRGQPEGATAITVVNWTGKQPSYFNFTLLYEVLRACGVGTIIIPDKNNKISIKGLQRLAGKQPYTRTNGRVFGFAGFMAGPKITTLVDQRYGNLYKQGQEAEQQNKYKKALGLYQIAASYLPWYPGEYSDLHSIVQDLALTFSRLEILSASPSTHPIKQALEPLEELLHLATEQGNEALQTNIYETAIIALIQAGHIQTAKPYLQRYVKLFPRQKQDIQQKAHAIQFITSLRKSKYNTETDLFVKQADANDAAYDELSTETDLFVKQTDETSSKLNGNSSQDDGTSETLLKDPKVKTQRPKERPILESPANTLNPSPSLAQERGLASDFSAVYSQFEDSPSLELIQGLIKHAQYGIAFNLLKKWQQSKALLPSLRKKLHDLELVIAFDRYFLGLGESPQVSEVDGLASNWQDFLTTLQSHCNSYENVLSSPHTNRKKKKGHMPFKCNYRPWQSLPQNLQTDLGGIPTWQTNKPKAFYIAILRRSLYYHLLSSHVSFDPEQKYALFLEKLIQQEKQFSYNRAALMALGAAEKYLQQEDFLYALHFFDLFLSKGGDFAIDNKLRAAKLGLILYNLELRPQFSVYKDQWEKQLQTETREQAGFLLFQAVLKAIFSKQRQSSLNLLLKQVNENSYEVANYYYIRMALRLGQWKALQQKEWQLLVNLAFLKQSLENHEVSHREGIKNRAKLHYKNWVGEIQKEIPKEQSFVGLLDLSHMALRFTIHSNKFHIFPLQISGQYLRAKMKQYLHLTYAKQPPLGLAFTLEQQLDKLYSSFLPSGGMDQRLTYLWLNGIHSLAPITPSLATKLFQVMDIDLLLSQPKKRTGHEFAGKFTVTTLGKRKLPSQKILQRKKPQQYLYSLATRVYDMEKLTLAEVSKVSKQATKANRKRNIYHIFTNVNAQNITRFSKGIASKLSQKETTWFLSSNFLEAKPDTHIANYNFLLQSLANVVGGPGVIHLRVPYRLSHAYFVRQFYERDYTLISISNRFARAYKHDYHDSYKQKDFAYRLVTPRFLAVHP